MTLLIYKICPFCVIVKFFWFQFAYNVWTDNIFQMINTVLWAEKPYTKWILSKLYLLLYIPPLQMIKKFPFFYLRSHLLSMTFIIWWKYLTESNTFEVNNIKFKKNPTYNNLTNYIIFKFTFLDFNSFLQVGYPCVVINNFHFNSFIRPI